MTQTTLPPDDKWNQGMVERVRPSNWPIQAHAEGYDLIAIGGGTAGMTTSGGAAFVGARSAMIERHLLGGDCLVTGCVPSKAILHAGQLAKKVREAAEWGITTEGMFIDFAAVMSRLREARATISHHDSAEAFKERGVDVLYGNAKFKDENTIDLDGELVKFKRAVIATGGRPFIPSVPGLREANPLTSDTVFHLTERPERLVVIGGGPIGCELGQAFQRLGSQVSIIGRSENLLPKDDPEASAFVEKRFLSEGIHLHLGWNLSEVREANGAYVLTIKKGDHTETVVADRILVAAGRKPNIENLGLEAAGIEVKDGGIVINDALQTTNRRVYAVGDVAGDYQFTHSAYAFGEYVVYNALFPVSFNHGKRIIPWATFTDPEVAHTGLAYSKLKERSGELSCYRLPLDEVDRYGIEGDVEGFAKVWTKKGSDTIVAATIVGSHAGNLISEFTLAITTGKGLGAISKTVYPYPSHSELVRKVADKYSFSRMTPMMRKLLSLWLKWGFR